MTFGAIVLLMIGISPLFSTGQIALPDEGVYSAQAVALSNGSWSSPRPAPSVINQPLLDPLSPSFITGDTRIAYSRHPLYSAIIGTFYHIAGLNGLILVSVIGGVLTTLFVGFICLRLDVQYGIPALLITAIGSPILFNSYIVNAHNLATALTALVLLSSIEYVVRSHRRFLPALLVAAFLIPMLRTEGGVILLALTSALALFALLPREFLQDKATRVRAIACSAYISTAAIGGFVADLSWASSISAQGGHYSSPTSAIGGSQTSFYGGVWSGLLQPWQSILTATATAAVILILVATAALALRIFPHYLLLPQFALASAAVASVYLIFSITNLVYGLFAAMPVAVFSLIFIRKTDARDPQLFLFLLTATIGASLLAMTIYGDGGSSQWGGRLFQVLLPAIVPMTIIGVHRALQYQRNQTLVLIVTSLVIISLGLGVSSLKQNLIMRERNNNFVLGVASTVEEARTVESGIVEPRMVTLLSVLNPGGASRAFWSTDVKLNLLYTPIQVLPSLTKEGDFSEYDQILLIIQDVGPTLKPLVDSLAKELSSTAKEVPVNRRLAARAFIFSR